MAVLLESSSPPSLLIPPRNYCIALHSIRRRGGGDCLMAKAGDWMGLTPTFKATSTACVLLTKPTTTEPCFTASPAYST